MSRKEKILTRSFNELSNIWGRARFDLIFAAVSALGGSSSAALLLMKNVPNWLSAGTIFVWLLVLFALIFFRSEKRAAQAAVEAERTAREAEKAEMIALEEKLRTERKDETILLTDRVISYSTRSLRMVTEELRSFSNQLSVSKTEIDVSEGYKNLKTRMLRHVCTNIRTVFEGDPQGFDRSGYPHSWFKIALFEPDPDPLTAKQLRRTFYDYPEGIDPSPKTEIFNIAEDARAAVVLAFINQSIVVIEDIKIENEKPPDVKRWINKRENQAEDYESMICVSIVSGIRGQPDRKCLGVLVVDTNRECYFRENRSFQGFLGNLLNPFRTILTFILEVKEYFHEGFIFR